MKAIFEGSQPRQDVLSGELRDEMFAAKLEDVVQAKADPIYQDPTAFFANTHPRGGAGPSSPRRSVGRQAGVRRVPPIIRLETAFGGGKTQSLIAL